MVDNERKQEIEAKYLIYICHHEGVICIGFRRPQKMKKFYADVISRIITEMTSASYKVFL